MLDRQTEAVTPEWHNKNGQPGTSRGHRPGESGVWGEVEACAGFVKKRVPG